MTIDAGVFRQAMSRFASGVTVVTAAHNDALYGLTVSSFTSLSLEPRLVLVCLDKGTRHYVEMTQAKTVGINILSRDQETLSSHFASHNRDDWAAIDYQLGEHGVPLLHHALVQLECRITQCIAGGDHTIVICEILAAHIDVSDTKPLLYYRGAYGELVDQE